MNDTASCPVCTSYEGIPTEDTAILFFVKRGHALTTMGLPFTTGFSKTFLLLLISANIKIYERARLKRANPPGEGGKYSSFKMENSFQFNL